MVGGRLARAEDRPLRPDRGLGHVVRRDRRVPLDRELELDARRVCELPFELAELLLRVLPDRVGDLDVLALYLESQPGPPGSTAVSSAEAILVANRASEGDDLDPSSAAAAERGGGRRSRGAGGVDVIHERDSGRHAAGGNERSCDVASARLEAQAALRSGGSRPAEGVQKRKLPTLP